MTEDDVKVGDVIRVSRILNIPDGSKYLHFLVVRNANTRSEFGLVNMSKCTIGQQGSKGDRVSFLDIRGKNPKIIGNLKEVFDELPKL